jgi:hypothetical protein
MFWDEKKVYAIQEPSTSKISLFPSNSELQALGINVTGLNDFKWSSEE